MNPLPTGVGAFVFNPYSVTNNTTDFKLCPVLIVLQCVMLSCANANLLFWSYPLIDLCVREETTLVSVFKNLLYGL